MDCHGDGCWGVIGVMETIGVESFVGSAREEIS